MRRHWLIVLVKVLVKVRYFFNIKNESYRMQIYHVVSSHLNVLIRTQALRMRFDFKKERNIMVHCRSCIYLQIHESNISAAR